jgi:hypothetical protein
MRACEDCETDQITYKAVGNYNDGHAFDRVQYLEPKIILKPDRFSSIDEFRRFGKIVGSVARKLGVEFIPHPGNSSQPQIREIVFGDTSDFRLYNHSLILRRRIRYHDGFPGGDPEIVFGFRNTDQKIAAAVDVRPNIAGHYRVKFKVEALPLKEEIGGIRFLYSHNCVFGLSQMHYPDKLSMQTLMRVFPAMSLLKTSPNDRITLVRESVIEEVSLDLGVLKFGKGVTAPSNVALWRARGEHKPVIGEFAYQFKLDPDRPMHEKVKKVCEQFFINLQFEVSGWISLGTTKTGMVYRLDGNPAQNNG